LRHLITGGAGFIGSHLADALIAAGDAVVVLDDFSTGRRENIAHLEGFEAFELIVGSTLDEELVDDLVRDTDTCIHLASAVGVALVVDEPLETLQSNVRGCDIVISAAARRHRRLLFASTSEVYGKQSRGALDEDADRILGSTFKSRWSYAIAKSYGEALVHAQCRQNGARGTVVRLFNTIGARQTGAYGMVVPRLVRQALTGADLTVFGDGLQTRCFTHVLDTVRAIEMVLAHDLAIGRALNIGNDVEISIIELAARIIDRCGSNSRIVLVPYKDAYGAGFEELGRRKPDVTALRRLTGWSPEHTLDDAIDDVIAHERRRVELNVERRSDAGALRLAG
jgi:UDP-glucose 4-epimerase